MDFANYLQTHPEIKHGEIKILFTPDEEVGKGTAKVNLEKLGAQFAYTLDGGDIGSLEDETFSADGVHVVIHGVIAHPGYAKGKMVNAMKIAGQILSALPQDRLSPESTEGKRGFIHPVRIEGLLVEPVGPRPEKRNAAQRRLGLKLVHRRIRPAQDVLPLHAQSERD